MRRRLTIPSPPTSALLLMVAASLGVVLSKFVLPLPNPLVWAALLALVVAAFLLARGRVGVARAAGLLVLALGIIWLGVGLLALAVFGGEAAAVVILSTVVALAVRRVYIAARSADKPLFELRVRAPGLPLAGAVVVSLASVAYGNSARWDGESALLGGLTLWTLAALMWFAKLLLAVARGGVARPIRADLARWLAPPLVGVLGLLAAGSDLPFLIRFELSRPAIEDSARTVQAGEAGPDGEIGLGLFGTGHVRTTEDGSLEFYLGEDDSFLGDDYYLVWVPSGQQPRDYYCFDWQHVDGQWWLLADDLWCEF